MRVICFYNLFYPLLKRIYERDLPRNFNKWDMNSAKKLRKLNDEIMLRMIDKKCECENAILAKNSRFARLRDLLSESFVWINSIKKLYREGLRQHNCVYSYKDEIRADICAVYHWRRYEREYTIEFGIQCHRDGKGKYVMRQMKQNNNEAALGEDVRIVEKILLHKAKIIQAYSEIDRRYSR